MPSFFAPTFQQTVTVLQFEQIGLLLQQMAAIDPAAILLIETDLSGATYRAVWLAADVQNLGDRCVLLVSSGFSALLLGARLPSEAAALSPTAYQISLTFEPAAIAAFLDMQMQEQPASPLRQQFERARTQLQPNDPSQQSEFTLRLVAALAPLPSPPAEAALRQQVEQERLLNQVITQIRQSLEPPLILQTAVEQVQQFLQVDRLVIYQLGDASAAPTAPTGVITYEAKTATVPSILHLVEECHLLLTPQHRDRYRRGYTLAVRDVEARYTNAPCLLKVLQQAQVRAKLVAPIVVGDRLWGLLIAHQCHQPRTWQRSEQQFLLKVAEHLAIAIGLAQLYTQVQEHNHTLELRVAERTQDLHDALLAAQTADRVKGEFLAAMSHELRTPLTTVIGMSATLLRWSFGELSDRQRHYLQAIHSSGERLMQLVNDVLDLSQLEAGKAALNLSEFSVAHLTRQTLKSVQEKAMMAGIELELDLRIDPIYDRIRADPRRVRQILLNLLSNAIKFTPEGGKVTLRAYFDQSATVFQVKDTGIGIAEQQRSLLFQKFRQLDASYHREYEGAGIGLALTKQLVELHGGSISVDSIVGVGSVFTVRLPQPGNAAADPSTPALRYPMGRIVLLESDEDCATLICDLLTAAGYQLVWLLDPETAIEQIEVLSPIAVITAAQTGAIDGRALIQALRQNPATRQQKIVVLIDPAAHPADYLAIGADQAIAKPVQPEFLLQQVSDLTAQSEADGDAARQASGSRNP